jgi:hypothetical protein
MWLRYERRRTREVDNIWWVDFWKVIGLWVWSLEVVQRCGEYTYRQGEMRWIVGEKGIGKEMDGCPLTVWCQQKCQQRNRHHAWYAYCLGSFIFLLPWSYTTWGDSMRWHAIGTVSMRRPKQAEGFQHILVKLCKSRRLTAYQKPTTHCTYKVVDILLSILTHQTLTMPSVLGLSCLSLSLPLSAMLHTYLWSSLRSFPILWPCLLPFHCKSSFHTLFYTVYFHLLTVALLIRCLVVIFRAIASVLPVV